MEKLPTSTALKKRLRKLGDSWENPKGEAVIYVMSRDQRVRDNHALLAAQAHALVRSVPLAVVFCLKKPRGFRAREQYDFMLSGLTEVERELNRYNIPFMMLIGEPIERLLGYFGHIPPVAVYTDFSPLHASRTVAKALVKNDLPVIEVDTHNVVPAWVASSKQEFAARTLRPKIHLNLPEFLTEPETLKTHPYAWPGVVMNLESLQEKITEQLSALRSNGTTLEFEAGETAAEAALENFMNSRLKGYAHKRNDPSFNGLSNLSPYFHFGQLSTLRVALTAYNKARTDASLTPDVDALIEEMIIRKELSDNFCLHSTDYRSLAAAPEWATKTLHKHASDPRDFVYTRSQFEDAETHDPSWNAAQIQLRQTGKMHGYMRMYWAKKVLEWSKTPDEALQTLIYLNDFYSIDGGDPNGYVGILWSIAGLHDRPWGERPIYGTVRSMVAAGLKRKFNIAAYVQKYHKLP